MRKHTLYIQILDGIAGAIKECINESFDFNELNADKPTTGEYLNNMASDILKNIKPLRGVKPSADYLKNCIVKYLNNTYEMSWNEHAIGIDNLIANISHERHGRAFKEVTKYVAEQNGWDDVKYLYRLTCFKNGTEPMLKKRGNKKRQTEFGYCSEDVVIADVDWQIAENWYVFVNGLECSLYFYSGFGFGVIEPDEMQLIKNFSLMELLK